MLNLQTRAKWSILLVAAMLSSCFKPKISSNSYSLDPFASTAVVKTAEIRPILAKYNCISCHAEMNTLTDDQWKSSVYLDHTNWKQSKILARVRRTADAKTIIPSVTGMIENMPTSGETVASADFSKLTRWAQGMLLAPVATPRPTATPVPTATPRPTTTPVPTATPRPTATPVPTATPRPTATPVPSATPRPTATATPPPVFTLSEVRTILTNHNCIACHGDMAMLTDAGWKSQATYINLSDWKKSALLTRIRRNTDTKTLVPSVATEDMPKNVTTIVPSADFFKLAYWVQALVQAPAASPTPTPRPTTTPVATATPTPQPSPVTYSQFSAVINARCISCHDSSTNGNFKNLDQNGWLLSSYLVPGQPDSSKIYFQLVGSAAPTGAKNMPKGSTTGIPVAEREIIRNYILGLQGQAPTCGTVAPHYARAALLNKREFNYAILDILGLEGDHSTFFPAKIPDTMGFDNKGGDYPNDAVFTEALYDKIESLIDALIGAQTQAPYQQFFNCAGGINYNNATCRDTLFTNLGLLAFRRPITAAEKTLILNAANKIAAATAINKLKTGYIHILMSPEFLFKIEPDNGVTAVRDLTHYEIASRLSFLLWSSVPDATLLNLAAQGQLRNATVLTDQVTRMINDVKGVRFIDAFTDQWLRLANFSSVSANPTEFPNFQATVKQSMLKETQAFLRDVLRTKPIAEMLTANYSYLNDEMAAFYGITVPGANSSFVKVTLPQSSYRRGFMSQGLPMMMSFKGSQHKPVLRGSYILSQILCDKPAGTVPAAPSPAGTPQPNATFKDVLAAHRNNPSCAGCHMAMDPIGLGFDHFNGIGQYRSHYGAAHNNQPVDTTEVLYGQAFQSSYDMTDIIASSDNYYKCVVKNSYGYALKVPDSNEEKCSVNSMASEMRQQNLNLVDFIKKIVVKDQFIKRKPE